MRDSEHNQATARWQHVEEIYHAALPLAETERATFVSQKCVGDAQLQEEVRSLLAADDETHDFLQASVFELGLEALAEEHMWNPEFDSEQISPAPEDIVNTTVDGRYHIVELLGGGGFGDVYKARDAHVHLRPVAIKVLKEKSLQKPWIMTKFQQEIEALAKIIDSGVVGIIDAGKLPDGKPYLVMEFVEGITLHQLLKDRRLSLPEIAEMVRQIGRTLSAAHDEGIIHRDLKPENIMIRHNASGDLQVKIIDFGIAKVIDSVIASSTETGLVAGTYEYMSPEQLMGRKVTAVSDIFTLGIIAYEMTTGCRPFNPEANAQLHELQQAGVKVPPRDLRPGLPAVAERIILNALSYHPAERCQRARQFGDELARSLTMEIDQPPTPQLADTLPDEKSEPEEAGSGNEAVATPVVSSPAAPPHPQHTLRARSRWLLIAAALLVTGGMIYGIQRALRMLEQQPPAAPAQASTPVPAATAQPTGPERTLTYQFMVRSLKTKGWVASTGTEAFHTGEEFYFAPKPTQDGALYLINRGKEQDGSLAWVVVFPTKINHNGDARLKANEELQMPEPNRFTGSSGKEELLIIWADKPIEWLEPFIDESSNNRYRLSEEGRVTLQKRLLDAVPMAQNVFDEDRFLVTLKGRGEIIVGIRTLSHKPPR